LKRTQADLVGRVDTIALIEQYCSEILIHAADVEGLSQGIDEDLVKRA
jgi:phosphoribosylformimino-5-aminoimidazole carboxamide ribotide isomerase